MTGSWKTSLFGGLAVLPQVLTLLFPKFMTPQIAMAISVLFAGIGLTQSKDSAVTGGTIPNTKIDASVVANTAKQDKGI